MCHIFGPRWTKCRVEEKEPLAYCHALSSRNASGHLCINFLPSSRVHIHSGLSDGLRHQADHSESTWTGSFSPPWTLRSCLRVAVRGGAARQGRLGVEREPIFGSQGVRIPEDLCLVRWDGLCLLCFGAVPQHRCAAEIVATAARSAARCSQRLQNPEAGTPVPRLVQTSGSLGATGGQA